MIEGFLLLITALVVLVGTMLILILPGDHIFTLLLFYIVTGVFAYFVHAYAKKLTKSMGKTPNNHTSVPANDTSTQLTPRLNDPNSQKNRVLLSVRTAKPFEIFSTSLVIEEDDIIILRQIFFGTTQTESILTQDIFSIILNSGPFFASLIIQRKTNIVGSEQRIEIPYLKRQDALTAKFLIDGLTLEEAKAISVPKTLPPAERRRLLIEAGQNKQVEREVTQ